MGKKQFLTTLPEGDYEDVTPKNIIVNDLPEGDYETIETTRRDRITDFNPIGSQDPDKVESAITFLKKQYGNGNTSDTDFDALRNVLADTRATNDQRKMAIDAIQKKSMNNDKYAFELQDNGVSVPKSVPYGDRPKDMETLQSIWGSQDKANDDNIVTDVAKHVFNIFPSIGQQAVGLVQLGHEAIFDEESKGLNELSKAAEFLKFKTDEDLKGGVYDFSKVKSYKDLTNLENFDLRPEKIWGTALELGQTVAEMVIPAGQIMEGIKGAEWAYKIGKNGEKVLSTAGKVATAGVSSFLVNAPEVADAADKAGLKGRDKALFVSTVGAAISSIDVKIGLGSKIVDVIGAKALNKEASDAFLVNTAKSAIIKNADGTVTKESLDKAISETIKEYPKQVSSWIANAAKGANIQGVEEVGQAVIQKAGEQAWDKLTPETKAKFGTDMFSPQSIGEYIANYSAALVGGGVGSIALGNEVDAEKKKYFEQSKVAYNAVKQGEDAVTNFKNNLKAAVDNGSITPKQHENAVFKVDAYNKYEQQTKDLNLDDKQKKEAFELSFNIEALKSEIDLDPEDIAKLDPIAHAKINSKKKLIKGLQEELDKIIQKKDIQTETKVDDKDVADVAKEFEPKKEGEKKPMTLKELNEKLGGINPKETEKLDLDNKTTEAKPYKRFQYDRDATPDFDLKDDKGNYEFNKLPDPLSRKRALTDYMDSKPELNNEVEGYVHQSQNNVWQVDVGNGRWMQLASSINPETLLGDTTNMPDRTEEVKDSDGRPLIRYKDPVIVKMETIIGDRKGLEGKPLDVFNVYRKSDGKYIMSLKEKQKGDSSYSEGEKKQLDAIKERGYVPYDKQAKPKAPKVNYTELAKKAQSEKELDAVLDQADKAGEAIDIDEVAKKRATFKKVKKPTLKLKEIKDKKALAVKVKINKTYKGEVVGQRESTIENEQKKVTKKFEQLQKLLDCIHG